jgi:hypothetical protein
LGVKPEDSETTALQLAHRQAVTSTNNLYYIFKDIDELRRLTAEIDVVRQTDFRVDISRIDKYAPAEFIGREQELALLNDAWLKVRHAESSRPHVLTFVAIGGAGKTSLVAKWLTNLAYQNWPGCDSAFAWSFYSQGTGEQHAGSSDLFLKEALTFFGDDADKQFAGSGADAYEKGQRLARIVSQRRALLILDGLEPLQYPPTSPTPGELKDAGIAALLMYLAVYSDGLCVVTTRYSLSNLKAYWQTTAPEIRLTRLSQAAGVHLLRTLGVKGSAKEFETLVEDVKGHALTLNMLGAYLGHAHGGDITRLDFVLGKLHADEQERTPLRVMQNMEHMFASEPHLREPLAILKVLALFDRPAEPVWIESVCQRPVIPGLTDLIVDKTALELCADIASIGPGIVDSVGGNWRENLDPKTQLSIHPLFAEYFRSELKSNLPEAWTEAHRRLCLFFTQKVSDEISKIDDLTSIRLALYHGSQGGLLPSGSLKDWILRLIPDKLVEDVRTSSPTDGSAEKPGQIRSVFISYRRLGEAQFVARIIRAELRHRGCAVFLDVDSLGTGRFDDALLQEIKNARNFLIVLSPNCLDRCSDEEDWFRRELAYALSIERNIIPILMDGFGWPDAEQLPEDIRSARRYHGLLYSHDYFDAMMGKVEGFLR